MSEEEFFEGLRERAGKKTWCKNSFWRKRRQEGIDATIKALKEMMVGEPMKGKIEHSADATWVLDRRVLRAKMVGIHGTDGEEVAVLIVRL